MRLITCFLFGILTANAAITRVGTAVADSSTYMQNVTPQTSIPTGALATTTGGFIVACTRWYQSSGQTVSSVTDTAGNTYTALASASYYAGTLAAKQCFASANITGHAANAVTFTMSAGVLYAAAWYIHYTGLASTVVGALDVYTVKDQAAGSGTITSDAFSTAQDEEVVLAVGDVGDLAGSWTAGSSLTLALQAGYNVMGVGEQITSSALSSVTRAMTSSATAAKSLIIITLKAPAAAPAVQKRRPVIFQ